MAPSFCIKLSESEQGQLLDITRLSIESGLTDDTQLQLDSDNLASSLSIPLGGFVTLTRFEVLCAGSDKFSTDGDCGHLEFCQ